MNRFDDETKQSFIDLYDKIDADVNTEGKKMLDRFHGYLGRVALLRGTRSRTAKDHWWRWSRLYMQDIDGKVFKCYHDNIEYIYEN